MTLGWSGVLETKVSLGKCPGCSWISPVPSRQHLGSKIDKGVDISGRELEFLPSLGYETASGLEVTKARETLGPGLNWNSAQLHASAHTADGRGVLGDSGFFEANL